MMGNSRVPDVDAAQNPTLQEIFVVYDADGTVAGELVYLARKWFGKGHCAACDITHGPRREKQEWKNFKQALGVPVKNIHRDEMDIELYRATRQHVFPNVVGRLSDESHVLLMDPNELDTCKGDVERFGQLLKTKLANIGISLGDSNSSSMSNATAESEMCMWGGAQQHHSSGLGEMDQSPAAVVPEM